MSKIEKSPSDLAYEKKLREYILKAFLSEISKILIFLLIALSLNIVKEYLAALFFLMLLRNNGGGLHFKHYISCLIVSFLFLYTSIGLAILFHPSRQIAAGSLLICALLGWHLVPITSVNRPAATPKQVNNSKRSTLLIILIFFFVICICPLNNYVYIGFWTTILHIFQLLIARKKGGTKNAGLGNQI